MLSNHRLQESTQHASTSKRNGLRHAPRPPALVAQRQASGPLTPDDLHQDHPRPSGRPRPSLPAAAPVWVATDSVVAARDDLVDPQSPERHPDFGTYITNQNA